MDTAESKNMQLSSNQPRAWVPWLLRVLSVGALVVAGYLSWTSLGATQVAGCGEGGTWDCHSVLQSRWSKWLGLPVSVPATAMYAGLLVTLCFVGPGTSPKVRRAAWSMVTLMAMMAGTAAVWFMLLQLFVIHGLCVYCVTVHSAGIAILAVVLLTRPLPSRWTLRLSGFAAAGTAVLIAGQVLVKPVPSYHLETYPGRPSAEDAAVQDAPGGDESEVMELALPEEAAPAVDGTEPAGRTADVSQDPRTLQPVSAPAGQNGHTAQQPRHSPPQPSLGPIPQTGTGESGSGPESSEEASPVEPAVGTGENGLGVVGQADQTAAQGEKETQAGQAATQADKTDAQADKVDAQADKADAQADKADAQAGKADAQAGKGDAVTPKPDEPASRVITVLNGQARLDIKGRPLIGSRNATHILVELFDYTCVHCRQLHKNLHRAQSRYGNQLAVLALPLPLNTQCNSAIASTAFVHRDACDLARCALAVWRRKPEVFAEYHDWLLGADGRTVSAARAKAAQLIGQDVLSKELSGTVLDVYFQQHAGLYRRANKGALPQLMSTAFTVKGEVSFDELCRLLEERLKVRPRAAAGR